MSHAFNDWNVVPEHSVRILEALKAKGHVPVMAYYHQGGHGGGPPLEMTNRWFTRYVYGVQNGVENDPRAWIVREAADRLKPTPYPDYPNPSAAPVTLRLQAGGVERGGLTLETNGKAGTETLVDNFSFDGVTLARAEWSNHRLIYATAELTEPVHISGAPRVTIRMSASKPAANLSVWLVALPYTEPQPAGRGGGGGPVAPGLAPEFTSLITRGWADPQNAKSLTKGEPHVPGRFVDVTFNLQPDDQILPKGKRIGVMIMSSDRDFTLWPRPGTEHHRPRWLIDRAADRGWRRCTAPSDSPGNELTNGNRKPTVNRNGLLETKPESGAPYQQLQKHDASCTRASRARRRRVPLSRSPLPGSGNRLPLRLTVTVEVTVHNLFEPAFLFGRPGSLEQPSLPFVQKL
jgi:hypothetical protein